ncbi:T9SS type A sorting domain-containing protein [Dyadobacter tibetensis]|uniref:T9SS type A sorting domain-containing protein n=1 Tax=Dyadobacter tibetensis TaxID=1211851 RepID=UPI0004710665|nr:T9SS type A sorting domain-containing protein [Dyadobacter tibetensis]
MTIFTKPFESIRKSIGSYEVRLMSLILLMGPAGYSQQSSQGNTTIFSGAQMTFFGNHDFATGGSGTQPGIIGTVRSATYGVLNYSSSSLIVTGANNANHVDGYVRNLGGGNFIYPVGDNGAYRPFAADGAGTTGAYFGVDPNSSVTSNLGGGNYPVLPPGAPFPTADKQTAIQSVSTKEYWDIDGTNSSLITLTWNANSDVAALTGSKLPLLTIVGWNPSTLQWEEIPSTIDAVGILGGASTLSSGSITTDLAGTPGNYTVYTLAGKTDPLPVTLAQFQATKENRNTLLNWVTTSETNSSHFDIERSANGKIWNQIGRIFSNQETAVEQHYHFLDKSPLSGENLYRLKMVDRDKTYSYSRIRNINFETSESPLAIYPNPANEFVRIAEPDQVSGLSLVDAKGVHLWPHTSKLDSEGQISVANLNPGVYTLLVVRKDGSKKSHKLLIAR